MNVTPLESSTGELQELGVADYKFLDSKFMSCELRNSDNGTNDREESLEADQLAFLVRKITQLDERLEKVEAKLRSGSVDEPDIVRARNISGSLAKIATPLYGRSMTSIARNEGVLVKVQTCLRVLKAHRFATFQSLLLFTIVAAMVSFGVTQLLNVDESKNSQYKPFKIEGIDQFFLNEELEYTIPKHYFLMHMQGWMPDIPNLYSDLFNENCEETLDSCFTGYMYAILTEPKDPGITASCQMIASDEENGLFNTAIIQLRNLSVFVDQIETVRLNGTGFGIFGVLLKLEFEALATHMNGPLYCNLELDMTKMREMLPDFRYDIYFMISRADEDSGLTGTSYYIESMSKLWRWNDDLSTKNFVYVYDEFTYDTQSKFQAEIYAEKRVQSGTSLTIETYPNPNIIHYVSYSNYSYMNWLADMGGFLSIAVGFFVFTATKITKLGHRGEVFHANHGILPIFSLPHRNAEELARLRSIVLDTLGITEEEYLGSSNL